MKMASQTDFLPGREACIKLRVPKDRLPKGLRPSTQEILILLQHYEKVADILDKCPRPDYEVLHILRILLEKGLIEKIQKFGAEPQNRCSAAVVSRSHRFHPRLSGREGFPPGRQFGQARRFDLIGPGTCRFN